NKHLMLTWATLTQKLLETFESSGKAEIAFNRLSHYELDITQDARQYYFEVMKICKETNPFMDEATSSPVNPTLESNISQNMNRSSQNSSPNDNDTQYNINYQ
ncbi:unnamed protein product, partial [Rotaria sp. Silwood1]